MNEMGKSLFHSVEETLTINREVIMGIGIIMVVSYHYNTGLWFQKLFYPGFLGVDIFLFFSGYGLCRSYETHSLQDFYKRRFTRIMPMFLLLAIVKCFLYVSNGGFLGLSGWICSLTTVSYWVDSGIFVDWYLCGLFALYLFFPVLFSLPTLGGGNFMYSSMLLFGIFKFKMVSSMLFIAFANFLSRYMLLQI